MSSKTISLKREAYERLRAARRYPSESFSEVVLRATWPEDTVTASELLARLRRNRPWFTESELDAMAAAKAADRPPDDKWNGR
ncbi:MAG: antitoxin VapB family protein [Vicinamibacterales bacterium]